MGDRFKLYIIVSIKSLKELYKIILEHASTGLDVGPIRDVFNRDRETGEYKKSNRKFILTTDDVYNRLKIAGYGNEENANLFISEYEIRSDNSAPKDSLMHYYFPNSEINEKDISNKLKFFKTMGIFIDDDYAINEGIVEFSNNVSNNTRILIKILIDTKECRVSWCKKRVFNKLSHRSN